MKLPAVAVAAALGALALQCSAAPMESDAAASAPSIDRGLVLPGSGADTSAARTLELLVEMQPRGEFNDRSRAAPARDPSRRPSTQPPSSILQERPAFASPAAARQPEQPPKALFGSEAVPVAPPRRPEPRPGEWNPPAHRAASPGEPGRSGTTGLSSDLFPPFMRDMLRFARDNREWVIAGGLGLFAVTWGGSILVGRGRR